MANQQKIQAAYDRAKQDLDMKTWVCGTAMCLGGAAMLNAGWHVVTEDRTEIGWANKDFIYIGNGHVNEKLRDELDLTREQSDVFHLSEWPAEILRVYHADKDRVLALRLAIKHFTGVEVRP